MDRTYLCAVRLHNGQSKLYRLAGCRDHAEAIRTIKSEIFGARTVLVSEERVPHPIELNREMVK